MHPLTKEKLDIAKLADRVRNLKTTLELASIYSSLKYLGEPCDVEYRVEPEVASGMQKRVASLSRAIRHRHVAYCLVRRGVDGIHPSIAVNAGIETKYTSEALNMTLVNHHRMRLSNAIIKYQSDHIERLLKAGIPTPSPKICGLGHFETDTGGNLVAEIKKKGIAYILPCHPGGEILGVADIEAETDFDLMETVLNSLSDIFEPDVAPAWHKTADWTGRNIKGMPQEPPEMDDDDCMGHDCASFGTTACDGCCETDDLDEIIDLVDEYQDGGLLNVLDALEKDGFTIFEEPSNISKCAMTSDLVEPRDEEWNHYSGMDMTPGSMYDGIDDKGVGEIPISKFECTYYREDDGICIAGGCGKLGDDSCTFAGDHFGDCEVYQIAADIDS